MDGALLGGGSHVEGARLSDLTVQTSSYGRVIPQIFGRVKMSGNVIWSTPIKETAMTTEVSTGKGGGSASSSTEYSYSVTLAIAIGEGVVDNIVRVWADSLVIDPLSFSGQYRFYRGTEDQLVDPIIEAVQGVGNAPAYRGLVYIVIEDLPLVAFGNRIPNFSFEVNKFVASSDLLEGKVEDNITGMNLIPGSGEFVYDTVVQKKISGEEVNGVWVADNFKTRINQTNNDNKANVLVALDQLEATCPNVEWVGLVVTWFGDSIDAGLCKIRPGVEFQEGAMTEPDIWSVGSYGRDSAMQLTIDANGNPVYGGTPSDQSVLRLLDELKARGKKVMFYPMFFMDVANKPWRGRVTGTNNDVANLFTNTNGYNEFINHYINLCVGKVDAFVIGSELIGLTQVHDGAHNYPAVDALVSIAATAKATLGAGVKITYAADWSEYHHTDGGWYNLDPLWSSPNIDFIGIDAYFPLTDHPQNGYDVQEIVDGWEKGEGYDWYYSDVERTIKTPLSQEYAWKNLAWWWENSHVNPDFSVTGWVAESKPIWFTEYGFPSVDGAANQPNVFYDPSSSESYFPRHSRGKVDFIAQRTAIAATEIQWKNSPMVEQKLLWTWDARPYPYWPDLESVWADTDLWETGHWLEGKLGLSLLADVVRDICLKAELTEEQIDVSQLMDLVQGYVLLDQQTARHALEVLQTAYFFDAVERDGVLVFVPRKASVEVTEIGDVLLDFNRINGGPRIVRSKDVDLPQKVTVSYINPSFNYQVGSQFSQRMQVLSQLSKTVNIPVVLQDEQAKNIADVILYRLWQERNFYEFYLPSDYLTLEVGDRVRVVRNAVSHFLRIVAVTIGRNWVVQIQAVADDVDVYHHYGRGSASVGSVEPSTAFAESELLLLDLPRLPDETSDSARFFSAVFASEARWNGAVIYRSDDGESSFHAVVTHGSQAIVGRAVTVLEEAQSCYIDRENHVDVVLQYGTLEGVSDLALLNGANLAMLGDEILQFRDVTLLGGNKYRLSYLLRRRLGTQWAMDAHIAPEDFVLLDRALEVLSVAEDMIGNARAYKAVTVGAAIDDAQMVEQIYQGRKFKPYAPVHVEGELDAVSNDRTIRWVRCTRVGGQWRDFVDVALGEVSEAYEVEIMDGGTVVRTIVSAVPWVIYSEAQQLSDFGAVPMIVEVRIYQLSTVVGRGYAAQALV